MYWAICLISWVKNVKNAKKVFSRINYLWILNFVKCVWVIFEHNSFVFYDHHILSERTLHNDHFLWVGWECHKIYAFINGIMWLLRERKRYLSTILWRCYKIFQLKIIKCLLYVKIFLHSQKNLYFITCLIVRIEAYASIMTRLFSSKLPTTILWLT